MFRAFLYAAILFAARFSGSEPLYQSGSDVLAPIGPRPVEHRLLDACGAVCVNNDDFVSSVEIPITAECAFRLDGTIFDYGIGETCADLSGIEDGFACWGDIINAGCTPGLAYPDLATLGYVNGCGNVCDFCSDILDKTTFTEADDIALYSDPLYFYTCADWYADCTGDGASAPCDCTWANNYGYNPLGDLNGDYYVFTDTQQLGLFVSCPYTCSRLALTEAERLGLTEAETNLGFSYDTIFGADSDCFTNDQFDQIGINCDTDAVNFNSWDNSFYRYYPTDLSGALFELGEEVWRNYTCSDFVSINCFTDSFQFEVDEAEITNAERRMVLNSCTKSCNIECNRVYEATLAPTGAPSTVPTSRPTSPPPPSGNPSSTPTTLPTRATDAPTSHPSRATAAPSNLPTDVPSQKPTIETASPTIKVTENPSVAPSSAPTHLTCPDAEVLFEGECKQITAGLLCSEGQVLDQNGQCLDLCTSSESSGR